LYLSIVMHKDKFSFSFPCKQAVIIIKDAGGYRSYSSFSFFCALSLSKHLFFKEV